MGPPETPSRGVIPQSPGLFPDIGFSPGMFSHQAATPQPSGPIIPQQRLFWDPSTATPMQGTPQQFHTPTGFPDDFNNSFSSNSTIMPQSFMHSSQDQPYDLPTMDDGMSTSFMDGSVFPAPFQTSPRPVPPPMENPTQFLSSPARRFGDANENTTVRRKMPELPAYHHQIQESRREREMIAKERRRSRTQKRPTDEDIVMSSVRRALSPRKSSRPSLSRSVTLSGLPPLARRSSLNFDNASIGSSVSSRSIRERKSSPIRRPRDSSRRSSASAVLRRKTSLTLEIDNHGVARTIMNSLPEDIDEEMRDDDDDMTDELSSVDENDQQMLYSFSGNPSGISDLLESSGDARDELRNNPYLSMGSDRVARISQRSTTLGGFDAMSTIRRVRGETLTSSNTDLPNPPNAQQALRAMMLDRSRSASSHASSSSMQFHSSPPLQQSQLAGYNASPTTITDPGLATPSTDADSVGSSGATRCVCNSIPPDGNIMIQWYVSILRGFVFRANPSTVMLARNGSMQNVSA